MNTILITELHNSEPLDQAKHELAAVRKALSEAHAAATAHDTKHNEAMKQINEDIAQLENTVDTLRRRVASGSASGHDTSRHAELLQDEESRLSKLKSQRENTVASSQESEKALKTVIEESEGEWSRLCAKIEELQPAIELAQRAAESYAINPKWGIGPAIRFKTLGDAMAHHCQVYFDLDNDANATRVTIDDQWSTSIGGCAKIDVLPHSLHWLSTFQEYSHFPHEGHRQLRWKEHERSNKAKALAFYFIEESGEFLTTGRPGEVIMAHDHRPDDSEGLIRNLTMILGSFDEKLAAYGNQLAQGGPLDLESPNPENPLHVLVAQKWQALKLRSEKAAPTKATYGRLGQEDILKIIGPAWWAFVASPWERGTRGTHALLKHLCLQRKTPHFFSTEHAGHFGFRLRTPDHDWILGEIYCRPDSFEAALEVQPDQTINMEGGYWMSEIGPVKIYIQAEQFRH